MGKAPYLNIVYTSDVSVEFAWEKLKAMVSRINTMVEYWRVRP